MESSIKITGKTRKMSFLVPEEYFDGMRAKEGQVIEAFNSILSQVKNGDKDSVLFDITNDIWSLDLEEDKWIIDELIEDIEDTQLLLLSGREKAGKSWICLQMIVGLASGVDVMGRSVGKKHKVLLYSPELSCRTMRRRLEYYLQVHDVRDEVIENIKIIDSNGCIDISEENDLGELVNHAEEFGADVVVIDPLIKVISGDENDNIAMARILGNLRAAFANTLVVLIHHNNKAGTGYRGASAIGGEVDYLFNCESVESSAHKETKMALKSRHGGYFEDTRFWWRTEHGVFEYGYYVPSEDDSDTIRLMSELDDGAEITRKELFDKLSGDRGTRNAKIKKLVSDGVLDKDDSQKSHKYKRGGTDE